MSVLNDLIRIKTSAQEDDLLKMLDEISIYEKLSVDETLKDLTKSEITRTKCPLLAAFTDGELYAIILAELAANIYMQIEEHIPEVISAAAEISLKQQRQMEILQKSIAQVEYRDLLEYDHESMKNRLAAVFTKTFQDVVTAVLIVKDTGGYKMYHGTYETTEVGKCTVSQSTPIIVKGKKGIFTMKSYSVLGNNGYRFGSYKTADISCDVMIGPDGELYLMNGNVTMLTYPIPYEERNMLNMSKKDAWKFAETVTSVVESVV